MQSPMTSQGVDSESGLPTSCSGGKRAQVQGPPGAHDAGARVRALGPHCAHHLLFLCSPHQPAGVSVHAPRWASQRPFPMTSVLNMACVPFTRFSACQYQCLCCKGCVLTNLAFWLSKRTCMMSQCLTADPDDGCHAGCVSAINALTGVNVYGERSHKIYKASVGHMPCLSPALCASGLLRAVICH